ncbi:MAG: pyridoxal phosphate-dependent aminotransferase [Candidatus Omnitrophica bacterium]|nr:pyridoxal phosphate-dependent aminotransferase [Candidatus Omnitrophota bacterium]
MTLATRTNWKLTQNKLSLRLKTLKESGAEILDLSESNPTQCGFEYLHPKLLNSLTYPANLSHHPAPRGTLEARQAIQIYYREKGVSVDPEHIFLTSSTSEGYSFLFRLITNPGDRILVPRPSYPLFDFLADLNDIELDPYPLIYHEQKWRINVECLLDALRPETKAIILVHPNNPTGSFVKKNELNEMLQIAKARSLALISDEVFSDYAMPFTFPSEGRSNGVQEKDLVSSVSEIKEVLTFTLSGISKVLGLPQMKLAWVVANGPEQSLNPLLERFEMILDTYLSVSTPIQNSLSYWLSFKTKIQNEIRNRIRDNRTFLANQTQAFHPVSLLDIEGGWYAILRLPRTQCDENWTLEFLEEDHVYVHPGYFFDFSANLFGGQEEAFIVLSLLPQPVVFQEGILRILKRIAMKG